MNKVVLMGRLTRDPEVKKSGETVVGRYALAVNRRFKKEGEAEADFINCVVFGKAAEFAEKFFKKGMQVTVSGRIQTGSYTNKEGQKVYTTDVILDEQEFAESRNTSRSENTPSSASSSSDNGFTNIPDDVDDEELPFN